MYLPETEERALEGLLAGALVPAEVDVVDLVIALDARINDLDGVLQPIVAWFICKRREIRYSGHHIKLLKVTIQHDGLFRNIH